MKLMKPNPVKTEKVYVTRAVDSRILIDNANHNLIIALANKGIYTLKETNELFGIKLNRRVRFNSDSVQVWRLHEKATKLGVSINWMIYHVPRDNMNSNQHPSLVEVQQTITKEQMKGNVASHVQMVRKEAMMSQPDFYYLLTGDKRVIYNKKINNSAGMMVSAWELKKSLPKLHVLAALARAEEKSIDHILYTFAHERGESIG